MGDLEALEDVLPLLQDALEKAGRYGSLLGTRAVDRRLAAWEAALDAVRRELDRPEAEEVWWCEEHRSTGHANECERHVGHRTMQVDWKPGFPTPCRMVLAKLLVDPQEGDG